MKQQIGKKKMKKERSGAKKTTTGSYYGHQYLLKNQLEWPKRKVRRIGGR